MLLGTIAGRIFNRLSFPQVTGYILAGLFLGGSFMGFLDGEIISSLGPILHLALGIIGFMIGAELHLDRFKKYGRSIYTILFAEAFLTFFLVAGTVILFTKKIYMGLILGALASATAPAATYSVLGENKARGPVTTTTLSIVALDDGLALLIYGFASAFARSFLAREGVSLFHSIAVPMFEIMISVFIGVAAAIILHNISLRSRDRDKMFPLTLGTIIFVVGLAIFFKVDPILASMVLGAVLSNMQKAENRDMFDVIKNISPPIFILFFVLVGARLDAKIVAKGSVLLLAMAYIISRSAGKLAGAYIGGKLSGAKETVCKYLGFCLFDQAGVAVGLSIAAYHSFSVLGDEGRFAAIMVINIITATTFLLQIISPPLIKFGIRKADEAFRNVSEEDIIKSHKISDVMDTEFFLIKENNNIHQVIDIMKRSSDYNFPVTSMNGKFMGVITLGEIRDAFYEEQMDLLILAGDIVLEVDTILCAGDELQKAVDIFRMKKIDYIPVLDNEEDRMPVGQLDHRKVLAYVNREMLLRQQELEA